MTPDPWQELVAEHALGVHGNGKWVAFEVGLNVSRQNGKGGVLEILELGGIFAFGERLIIHSAHEFATANEAFIRMEELLEEGGLHKHLKPRGGVSRSHGMEGFVFKTNQRIRYRTRTKGGGRGFTCDRLILDEGMMIDEFAHGALIPTLSARDNPQVIYAGSAVDQQVHEDGVVFARIRERAVKGGDPALAYFEWSAEAKTDDGEDMVPDQLSDELLADPQKWAQANPGLGIRISPDHIGHELVALDNRSFAVERLGIGDYPVTDESAGVIDLDLWDTLADEASKPLDPVTFAFDVSPDRKSAAIAAAGKRSDGHIHVEVLEHKAGTGWLVPRLLELKRHKPSAFICDGASPASSFIDDLKREGLKVEKRNGQEYADDCGEFYDLVDQEQLRHLGSRELRVSLKGAVQRPLGESWAWARKKSSVDITPLVAGTLAISGTKRAKSGGFIYDWSPHLEESAA